MGRWLVALVLAVVAAATVHAQVGRLLPANGKLGDLVGRQHPFPLVQIGSEVLRLAPGGLIYDQNNRTILHGMLPERATVLYVQNPGGEVARVYILRPDEIEAVQASKGR